MAEYACMLTDIANMAATDDYALSLLCKARECAEIYRVVAKRRKGCDGMGEFAMAKEELRETVDELIGYCKGGKCLPEDLEYDLDRVAEELVEAPKK